MSKITSALASTIGVLLLMNAAQGQTKGIVSLGYSRPEPIAVAPGQMITIFLAGLGGNMAQKTTSTSPLPTSLAGFTVSLRQSYIPNGPILAPIAQVFPARPCGADINCLPVVGVTLQIPFELAPNTPGAGTLPNAASLTVSDQAGKAASIDLNPVPDAIHVLRSSDAMISGIQAGAISIVTHADGSLVTESSPAKAGEELVAYAVGLGATNPAVKTGEQSPAPGAAATMPLAINYTFAPNAAPSRGAIPLGFRSGTSGPSPVPFPAPFFAGLSPGLVGLYQINFLAPSPPAGNQVCNDTVTSNLTITFVGLTSFDGATICVSP